jgi:hypothetical protein
VRPAPWATRLILLWAAACAPPERFRVGTFNIKNSADPVPANETWAERRDFVFQTMVELEVDLWAIQEALPDQLAEIGTTFGGDYDILSVGDDVLLSRKRRFLLGASGSAIVGDDPVRWILWADVSDRSSGRALRFHATHLGGTPDQLRQVRDRVQQAERPILAGDFNALPGPNPWGIFAGMSTFTADGSLVDVYGDLHPDNRIASGCGWDASCPNFGVDGRVDWILADPGFIPVDAAIEIRRRGTQNVSDHWPVAATLVL